MSLLSELDKAVYDVDENYHNFLLEFKRSQRVVYGFVEGQQDPSFYKGIIDFHLPNGWVCRLLPSGSREKVIKTLHEFDWSRFDRRRICFFIDADLVSFTVSYHEKHDNVYVTDGYSIENDIFEEYTMMRVLTEVMNLIKLTTREEEQIKLAFRERQAEFLSKIEVIMALVLCWRRERTVAQLGNINLSKIFDIKYDSVNLICGDNDNDRMSIAACHARATQYRRDDIDIAIRAIRAAGGVAKHVRGKYLAWFFVQFLISVHTGAARFANYAASPKASVSLGEANIMVIAAPRAKPPEKLRQFILLNYITYIRDS